MSKGTWTPWGNADISRKVAPGIMRYSTPGHGGYHLSPKKNQLVHPAWRNEGGWYEEDCAWAIAAFTFPEIKQGKPEIDKEIQWTLRQYFPDEYMQVTGEVLTEEDSYILRDRKFRESTKDRMVCVAAVGVGNGMVRVTACKGGRLENGMYASNEMHDYLVPKEEYATRGTIPFVVDTEKYQEVPYEP